MTKEEKYERKFEYLIKYLDTLEKLVKVLWSSATFVTFKLVTDAHL